MSKDCSYCSSYKPYSTKSSKFPFIFLTYVVLYYRVKEGLKPILTVIGERWTGRESIIDPTSREKILRSTAKLECPINLKCFWYVGGGQSMPGENLRRHGKNVQQLQPD